MSFIIADQFQDEQSFTGSTDHDAFTADARMQSERSEAMRRRFIQYRRQSAR
jgi:hypothetical protein